MTKTNLYDKKLYINREMSWLQFNRRCLDEANDTKNLILDRAKFLAICYSNMDEFFMIRVPGLIQQNKTGSNNNYPDSNTPNLLDEIRNEVFNITCDYELAWKKIKKGLMKENINIKSVDELTSKQKDWICDFYDTKVHPLLTPLALDVSHPFPFISNNSLNLAFRLKKDSTIVYARLKVPIPLFNRFIKVPSKDSCDFVLIEDIIKYSAEKLFPGLKVLGAFTFSVTRNADVVVTIDEACDLMSAVEDSIEGRASGTPVVMYVDASMPKNMISLFGKNLGLSSDQIITSKMPLSLSSLWEIANLDYPGLKEPALTPYIPPEFNEEKDIFETIRKKDRILYHPYESFSTVVRLLNESSTDPNVRSIKICLYRIGRNESIINALSEARQNGKSVSVLMELRAKFDEERNIQWAKELESIGVHVVYGPVNLKVHSKLLQIVRLENNKLVRYTHMSSGNYNVTTAKEYSDISFLTANQEIGEDVGELFNTLTGFFHKRDYKHLLVAPVTLKNALIDKIKREIVNQKQHKNGHIVIKANGLIDSDIIATLYMASMEGVKIELNIRGLCCLRPGIKGISDNITVISIVDRFLEHSRIYYFENNGNPEMYMGSSDMMPRNLIARVETLFPVLDKKMMKCIYDNILMIHFADNVKAKALQPDGSYKHVSRRGRKPLRSQQWFIDNRGKWHEQ